MYLLRQLVMVRIWLATLLSCLLNRTPFVRPNISACLAWAVLTLTVMSYRARLGQVVLTRLLSATLPSMSRTMALGFMNPVTLRTVRLSIAVPMVIRSRLIGPFLVGAMQ